MSNVWSRFEKIVKPEEVVETVSNFTPLPAGTYDFIVEKIEATENKDGLPCIKGRFRTVDGNKLAFYNQNLQNLNRPDLTDFIVGQAVVFINQLTGEEIPFTSLPDFADRINAIPNGTEFKAELSYTQSGFAKYNIVAKDEEIPF